MSQMIKEEKPKSCASCTSGKLEFPLSTWLVVYRKAILATVAVIAIISFIYIWIGYSRKTAEYHTIQLADLLAQKIQKHSPSPFEIPDSSAQYSMQQALLQLREIETKYPLLQSRYDGIIAEELLLEDNRSEFDPYAKRSIQQLRHIGLTDFADFSEISRLSGLQNFKEALTKAMTLKERLSINDDMATKIASPTKKYLLRTFLLLHIISLQKILGEQANFELSIKELKSLLGLTKVANALNAQERELASLFLDHLQEENELLLDYLSKTPTDIN
jgi:hypothetical protein